MSAVILIAMINYCRNFIKCIPNLEKTTLTVYYSFEDAILIDHEARHMLKFVQTVGHFCKRLFHKHKLLPFTRVNPIPAYDVNFERIFLSSKLQIISP